MPDQIEQTPQAIVTDEKRSDRDLQRSALRDLVALVGECQKTEIEIEQKHQAEQEAAKKKLDISLSSIEHRLKNLQNQVQEKHIAHSDRIEKELEAKIRQFKETDIGMRDRIAADYEKSERELKQKLQQATWLADSVLEAAQAQLRDESTRLKREDISQNEVLDGLENRAGVLMFSYGVNVATIPEAAVAPEIPADAEVEAKQQRERAEELLGKLETLSAPRLLTGPRPYLVATTLLIVAVMAAQLIFGSMPTWNQIRTLDLQWKQIGIFVGIAVLMISLVGVIVRFAGKMQAKKIFIPMREAIVISRQAGKARLERSHQDREARRQRVAKKRDLEVGAANERFGPLAAKIAGIRDKALAMQASDDVKRHERAESEREKDRMQLEEWRAKHLDDIRNRGEHDDRSARDLFKTETSQSEQQYQESSSDLQRRWKEGLARIQAPIEEQGRHQNAIRDLNDAAWKEWKPPAKFTSTVQFGELEIDPKQLVEVPAEQNHSRLKLPDKFSLPALLAFPSQASLLIQHDREGRMEALQTLQMVMTRLLTTQPPGRVRFTIIDPVGLGQNFAGFMHLADWDEALVGGRIWTSSEHIEQRLANLTEHMETVIQKYLRNEFETIDDYNAQAGELAEPYRFLVISDFPVGFTDESIRRLNSIAASGARCGVYTLIAHDRRVALPSGVNLDDIIAHSVNLMQEQGRFVWADDVFKQFPLSLDGPATEERLTEILTDVGQAAKAANRVEVSFAAIAPEEEEFWSEKSDSDLHVAIGRMGATRLQMFRLGRGVAQHALIAGKTGSGKSTLLHALVTNLAMWYSPDEIEFYLVDFKKGVEFKTYATHQLPHARAIAVESDREFGLSVLQRIDAELTRRGELFRRAGVQDLASYRKSPDPQIIPRTLLVIDEFQEFFSEDDKLAQDAAVLLDRLVRQGRAFGIHVLLGSQTIGGGAGLSRSTLGQMAVRVALQTTEVDSQLILGDNNSAARLLTRPGEAIYNDQGGLVEANSPFQVAWLPDDQREEYLIKVLERAQAEKKIRHDAAIFEGNAPADIRKNRRLNALIEKPEKMQGPLLAWVGDPVAIKEPSAVALRRQSGSNVLIIGQQDESALAMIMSSIVSLSAQQSKNNCRFVIFDGTPADSHLAGVLPAMAAVVPNETKVVEYRVVAEAIGELHVEMQRRLNEHDPNAPAIYVIICGLQRYRVLRKSEESFSYSMNEEEKKPQPDKQFAELLREGPALGIHIITWCDTPASVERTLERSSMREFDHRLLFQMSANDSSNLIDSPAANKLGFYRALAFSEEQGVMEKFRPYALPDKAWLEYARSHLAGR